MTLPTFLGTSEERKISYYLSICWIALECNPKKALLLIDP